MIVKGNNMRKIVKAALAAAVSSSFLSGCVGIAYRDSLRAIERNAHVDIYNYSVEMRNYIIEHGERKAMDAAMLAVKNGLKDPDSATFRNVRTVGTPDGIVVCGEYNAKNSYGGYVGFNRFVAGPREATTYDASSKNSDIIWATNVGINSVC